MSVNKFTWTTKNGRELELKDIDDNHLSNIQKMLQRLKKIGIVRISGDIWGDDIDAWLDTEWFKEDEKVLRTINKEVKKRGLKIMEKYLKVI